MFKKNSNKSAKANKKTSKNITASHTSLPRGYFDLSQEEKLEFCTRFLEGLNPKTGAKKTP